MARGTHEILISTDGTVTTYLNGITIDMFTGKLPIIHKIIEYVLLDGQERQRRKRINPDAYISTCEIYFVNRITKTKTVVPVDHLMMFSRYILAESVVTF